MEKVTFQNSRNLNLIGDFYSANSKNVIIMCHGFTGNRHEHGKFDKIALELNKNNFNILNFDFSGSGESDDDSITIKKEIDDLKSAINFIKNKGITSICLFGHSLGGLICLKNYNPNTKAMVLSAPVTNSKVKYIEKLNKNQLKEIKEKGVFTKIRNKNDAYRKKIVIDKEFIEERGSINKEELLSSVKCPVLIIHGTKDIDIPLEDSKTAIKFLKDSNLKIIENMDHDFENEVNEIISLSLNWFNKHLN